MLLLTKLNKTQKNKNNLFKTKSSKRLYSGVTSNAKIGFIGLGQMGSRMAENLIKKGCSVKGFDTNQESLKALESQGGKPVESLTSLDDSDVVITMLPSSPHVKSVYLDSETAILKTLKTTNALLIDSSTIDPNIARVVHGEAKKRGHAMIDAPVSGGVVGAAAGTLTFMVGGDESSFEQAKPFLQLMGKNFVHCGGEGNGQVAKICNNLVLAISMIGVSEAMNLGVKMGMDAKKLAGIFNTSSARCWSSDTYNPVPGVIDGIPSSKDYQGGFGVDLMAKDVSLAVNAAHSIKASVPLGAESQQVYNMISSHGFGGLDFSSVYKFLQGKQPNEK